MSDRKNLLEETLQMLKHCKKVSDEVRWVGRIEDGQACGYITWDAFKQFAENINYDAGYGSQEIAPDLVIVGKDWWLERHEYDGSESWEYKEKPKQPPFNLKLKLLVDNVNSDAIRQWLKPTDLY